MKEYIARLSPYLKPHKKSLALALFCTILSGALMAVFYWLVKNVLQEIVNATSGKSVQNAQLTFFMLAVMLWAVVRGLADFGREYFIERVWQKILAQLRLDLYSHFQSLSVGFFEKRRTGELMSRMTNDLGALQSIMTDALMTIVRSPIEVIVSIGAMFYFSWKMSFIIFFILPPIAFLVHRAGVKIRKATTMLQVQNADITHYLQEKISAMRLLQTFGTRDYEIKNFKKLNDESYRRSMFPVRISAILGPSIDFVAYLGVMIVLWVSVVNHVPFASLLLFLFAMHRAAGQLRSLAGLNNTLKKGQAAADRLFELLDTEPEIVDKPNAIDLRKTKVEGHLVFDNVRFSYDTGPDVLHGMSFEIKPGEVVALAGLSGSGKTTISALVPRLYDPTEGRVTLDGHDLRDVQQLSLRAHIGAVPQETTLFHGNIRENICYGSPGATDAQIEDAAHRAHAHEFISKMKDGYNTHIGEHGNLLSGGQRQRLAIARALLRDPRILILDEATSSLDAESEHLVQEALGRLMEGRTTLIIAHRFATIWRANKILVLEDGHIIEQGTHTQLLEERGLYHKLYQMQAFMDSEMEDSDDGKKNAGARISPRDATEDLYDEKLDDILAPTLPSAA